MFLFSKNNHVYQNFHFLSQHCCLIFSTFLNEYVRKGEQEPHPPHTSYTRVAPEEPPPPPPTSYTLVAPEYLRLLGPFSIKIDTGSLLLTPSCKNNQTINQPIN